MRQPLFLSAIDSDCDPYGANYSQCAANSVGSPNPAQGVTDMLSYTGFGVLLPVIFGLTIVIVSLAVFVKRMRRVKH